VVPSELARIVGLMQSSSLLAEGLGALLAPALVTLLGIRAALLSGGLALFALLLADRRGFWAIDRRAVGRVELLELVRGVPLFAALRVDRLEAVVAPLVNVEVSAGQEVIRQDSTGTRWYLVSEGELEIVVDDYVIDHVGRGDSFGERALLRDEPRNATVRAISDVSLLALEREDFISALTGEGDHETPPLLEAPRSATDALRRQAILTRLDGPSIDQLARGVEMLSLASGETLFSEGDRDDRYFVVLDGEIEIRSGAELRRVLSPGDGFGEIALLHDVARTTSAVARTAVRLVVVAGQELRQRLAAAAY
jgi:CRP-like cAMP-binding protein